MNTVDLSRRAPRSGYITLLQMQVQQGIAYPLGTLIDILAALLSTATVYYLWRAVFDIQPHIEGFDWPAMQSYVLLANAIMALLATTSARTMMQSIRSGAIASELLRPYSYLAAQLAQASGRLLTQGLISGVALALIGFGLADMAAPPSLGNAALFSLSVGMSWLLSCLLNLVLAILCFWTHDSEGLIWAYGITSYVFSGGLAPLEFLPGWLRALALALPFQSMIRTPILLYHGTLPASDQLKALLLQAVWVVSLGWAARLLWARGLRVARLPGG